MLHEPCARCGDGARAAETAHVLGKRCSMLREHCRITARMARMLREQCACCRNGAHAAETLQHAAEALQKHCSMLQQHCNMLQERTLPATCCGNCKHAAGTAHMLRARRARRGNCTHVARTAHVLQKRCSMRQERRARYAARTPRVLQERCACCRNGACAAGTARMLRELRACRGSRARAARTARALRKLHTCCVNCTHLAATRPRGQFTGKLSDALTPSFEGHQKASILLASLRFLLPPAGGAP